MDAGVPIGGTKGCAVHVQEIIRALTRRGASVDLFAARIASEQIEHLRGRTRIHLVTTLPPAGEAAERERASLDANSILYDALQNEGPFDIVYERYSLWSFAAMQYARTAGCAGLLEVNAPLIEEQARERTLVNRAGAETAARTVFAAADALLAVSRGVAGYLNEYPEARGRVHVLPNAVDPERFRPDLTPAWSPPPGSFVIGFVGTLKSWHGLQTLVSSFDLLHRSAPEARLLIVGAGTEEQRLVSDVRGRQLEQAVLLTGARPSSEIPAWLASMHVAVAPAPAIANFYFSPLKIFEYMAAGLPVVASDIGQISDVIRHGDNGLLCPPDDPVALASALDRLRRDPSLRGRVGASARATVLRSHTWDLTVERILQIAGTDRRDVGVREARV
jgi:glycosyltransferase involved in cell wall biosynthesis